MRNLILAALGSITLVSNPVAAATINGDYLSGAWCYASMDMMGATQEIGLDYIFAKDGTARFSSRINKEPDQVGAWRVENAAVYISPGPLSGGASVKAADADSFTLEYYVAQHIFTRGACNTPVETPSEASAQTAEYIPVYINESGEGILRYSEPNGAAGEYWLTIGMWTGSPDRPVETWTGDVGPYTGPEIAIAFSHINHTQIDRDVIAFELYQKDPYRRVAYFKPVLDAEKAEPMTACGAVSRIGECAK